MNTVQVTIGATLLVAVGFAWAVLLVLLGLSLGMTAPVAGLLAGSEPALAGPLDRGEVAPLTSASHYWRHSVRCCGFCVGVACVPSGARARDAGACRWAAWTIGAASSGLLGHGDVAPRTCAFHFWRRSVGRGVRVVDGFCRSG
jgi:hypothetical protein